MNYRSIADLSNAVTRNLSRIPYDIDLVAGIPRSGMLAAAMVALQRNLPMTDVDGLIEGRLMANGLRPLGRAIRDVRAARRILVIDDSVNSGRSMLATKQRLASLRGSHEFVFAAAFVACRKGSSVDVYFEEVLQPRLFEWNWFHHGLLAEACVDIDGVLCDDPTPTENDDGPSYTQFLEYAVPRVVPTVSIKCLVTCRLEKYRRPTEAWLQRHGIKYERLIMLDLPDAASRRKTGCHGAFKGRVYRAVDASLFIESSHQQAIEIAELAGKPVLSVEVQQMVYHGFDRVLPQLADRAVRRLPRYVRRLQRAILRHGLRFDPPRVSNAQRE